MSKVRITVFEKPSEQFTSEFKCRIETLVSIGALSKISDILITQDPLDEKFWIMELDVPIEDMKFWVGVTFALSFALNNIHEMMGV